MQFKSIALLCFGTVILASCGAKDNTPPQPPIPQQEIESTPRSQMLEEEYPMPNLISAYKSRIDINETSCTSSLPVHKPKFKEAIYLANINAGKVTVTQSGFSGKGGAIKYEEITKFASLPVGFDRSWGRQSGVLTLEVISKAYLPETEKAENLDKTNLNKRNIDMYEFDSPVDQNVFANHSPQEILSFEGNEILIQGEDNSTKERDLIVNLRFDGCSKTEGLGNEYATKIWTVQQLTIEEDPFGDDDLVNEAIFYYEYAPKLGWFITTSRSENEIYRIDSIKK